MNELQLFLSTARSSTDLHCLRGLWIFLCFHVHFFLAILLQSVLGCNVEIRTNVPKLSTNKVEFTDSTTNEASKKPENPNVCSRQLEDTVSEIQHAKGKMKCFMRIKACYKCFSSCGKCKKPWQRCKRNLFTWHKRYLINFSIIVFPFWFKLLLL